MFNWNCKHAFLSTLRCFDSGREKDRQTDLLEERAHMCFGFRVSPVAEWTAEFKARLCRQVVSWVETARRTSTCGSREKEAPRGRSTRSLSVPTASLWKICSGRPPKPRWVGNHHSLVSHHWFSYLCAGSPPPVKAVDVNGHSRRVWGFLVPLWLHSWCLCKPHYWLEIN